MSEVTDRIEELEERIRELEQAAGDAVVPGDARGWARQLHARLESLEPSLRAQEARERDAHDRIEREDPGQLTRVQNRSTRREALHAAFVGLKQSSLALAEHGDPTRGKEPTAEIRELREQALGWIVRLRAHRAEMRTLLLEAVNRDRGVQD